MSKISNEEIGDIIDSWIKINAKEYRGSTDITPPKAVESLLGLFQELKSKGVEPLDLEDFISVIAATLAPKNTKALKYIGKHSKKNQNQLFNALSVWCYGGAKALTSTFNEIFELDENTGLDAEEIYRKMCKMKNVGVLTNLIEELRGESTTYTEPLSRKEKSEHFAIGQKEKITLGKKVFDESEKSDKKESFEIEDDYDNIIVNKKYKKFSANQKNVFTECPDISDYDENALALLGLSGVPKERL